MWWLTFGLGGGSVVVWFLTLVIFNKPFTGVLCGLPFALTGLTLDIIFASTLDHKGPGSLVGLLCVIVGGFILCIALCGLEGLLKEVTKEWKK